MKTITLLIFCILILQSCKKDTLTDCVHIPNSDNMNGGYDIALDNLFLTYPVFNVNNDDEILIYNTGLNNDENELFIYNIKNKTKNILFTGRLTAIPKWKNSEWIYLAMNGNIWKLHSVTKELLKVSNINAYTFDVNYNADKIIFNNPSPTKPLGIIDVNGNLIDSIEGYSNNTEWGLNNKILLKSYDNIVLLDYTAKIKRVLNDKDVRFTSKMQWINNIDFVWSNKKGIYKTNSETNVTTILVEHCNSILYRHVDYSKLKNLLLWEKSITKIISKNTLHTDSYIVTMNTDGTNEQIISIP